MIVYFDEVENQDKIMEFMEELAHANSYNLTTDVSWSTSGKSQCEKSLGVENSMILNDNSAPNDHNPNVEICVPAVPTENPELGPALPIDPSQSSPGTQACPNEVVNVDCEPACPPAPLPDQRLKRSISTESDSSNCGPAQQARSVVCGAAQKLFDAQKKLARVPSKPKKKRMVKTKSTPKSTPKSDGLRQKKLSVFFKAELGLAQPSKSSSSEYEADRSGCGSDS